MEDKFILFFSQCFYLTIENIHFRKTDKYVIIYKRYVTSFKYICFFFGGHTQEFAWIVKLYLEKVLPFNIEN